MGGTQPARNEDPSRFCIRICVFAFCISHYAFFYFITPIVSALQSSAGRSTEGFTPVSRALWP